MDDQTDRNNDLNAPVTKFCLALEKDRRTPEGRIRSRHDFREHFFPYDESAPKIASSVPAATTSAGRSSPRGESAAARRRCATTTRGYAAVVHDAFVAGDIDDQTFEDGLAPDLIIGWVRARRLVEVLARRKAHQVLDSTRARDGLRSRAVRRPLVSRHPRERRRQAARHRRPRRGNEQDRARRLDQKIHESGDGSPRGLSTALGWSTLVAKTSNAVLLSAMDAFAQKNGS